MSTATSPLPQTTTQRELVEAAVLAPSPDNNQPWKFAVEGDRLLVYLDSQRALPSDVNSMFDLIGVGAAIENLCIAAREHGLAPRVEAFPPSGDTDTRDGLDLVAGLEFPPRGKPDPLHPHLAARCTNRKLYSTRPVAEASLQSLARAAEGFPEIQLDFVADRPRIRSLAGLVAATDLIRFQYEPFHDELFRQLRFSAEEAEGTCDGLDVRTFELPPGAAGLLRLLRPWRRMQRLHRLGLGRLLTLPSAVSVRRSGALGVLSASEPAANQFLAGGRALERVWLAAQAEGVALHPLGSSAIFFGHLRQLGAKQLSARHQRRLSILVDRFERLVPQASGRTLLMLFRLGYAPAPHHRSLRRPAAWS